MIQNSPEWHEWRMKGIGASEIAAILGVCPYNTAYDIWLVKTGRSKGFQGNSFTQHGQELEAKARSRYELINMDDMLPACATHPTYPVCRASLDGVSPDQKLLLEIKCPKGLNVLNAAKAGRVLDHYWPQVQFQLAVTGAEKLDFFVYHDDSNEDALVEVFPSLKDQGLYMAKAIIFWEGHVLTDKAPPLTGRDTKVIEGNKTLLDLSEMIADKKNSLSKTSLDALKAKAIELGGHPKIRCGRIQISTVNRNGKFSYHRLTISEEML